MDGSDEELSIQLLGIDEDYFEFFGIDVLAGRNLTRGDVEGRREGRHFYLINESAAEFLGWDDPVGKELTMNFYGRLRKGPRFGNGRGLSHQVSAGKDRPGGFQHTGRCFQASLSENPSRDLPGDAPVPRRGPGFTSCPADRFTSPFWTRR